MSEGGPGWLPVPLRPNVVVRGLVKPGDKTLLLLVASNRRRGAEVFGERLKEGLGQLGWDVDFVAVQAADTDRAVSATPLASPAAGGRLNPRTVLALRRRIQRTQPAIVLANGGATLRYAVAAQTMLSNPPVLAYGSIGEPRYWLRSPRHVRMQRFFQGRADTVLAVSEMTRSQLISDLLIPPERVHVAPTGVPPEFFIDKTPVSAELRLLFLGSLSPEKNPLAAVEVVGQLGASQPVHLRLVGAGPLESTIAAKAAAAPSGSTIELTGSVADVMPHLVWADLLLLPSRTEGLPGAVLEAGAAGVPTVAFDVGGTRETMLDETSGMIVPVGDIAGMTEAVRNLAADPARLEGMGREQQSYVRSRYSLEAAIRRFDELLSAALKSDQ